MAESIIEIRGLGKSFYSKNTEVTALRDINLTVEKGDIFGIIGMSGALPRARSFSTGATWGV